VSDRAICPLSESSRKLLFKRIDDGEWKNSWHLPVLPDFRPDWNNLQTVTKIRDILLEQRAEHTAKLREVETCMDIVVDTMIKMEKQIKENNEPEQPEYETAE
jgi:hypothetical protein